MKGNSNTIPELVVKCNNKTQIRYDIVEVEKENPDKTSRTSYDWEYVEIEGAITRAKIIDAIIANVHSKDSELSLINNELASPGTTTYADYQALRQHAKDVADEVVSGSNNVL